MEQIGRHEKAERMRNEAADFIREGIEPASAEKIKAQEEAERASAEELTEDIESVLKMLSGYENEIEEELKKVKFEALRASFEGLELENRVSTLDYGTEAEASDRFEKLMKIKSALESDPLYFKKAA